MFYTSRPAYEMLDLAASGEPSAADLATYIQGQYPKSTAQAAAELVRRGLAASVRVLHYLLEAETLPKLDRGAQGLLWNRADIDRAAEVLDTISRRTPWGFMCEQCNLEPDQVAVARHMALASKPGAVEDDFALLILPGADGAPATCRYMPLWAAAALVRGK